MSSFFKPGGLSIVLFVIFFTGCGENKYTPADFELKNGVYHNKYFDFSIQIPDGWFVPDEQFKKNMSKVGRKMVAGDNAELEQNMEKSEEKSHNLLAFFQHAPGSPESVGKYNPSMVMVAENLTMAPGVKTGKDYLIHSKAMLAKGALKIDVGDFAVQEVNGIKFDVMPVVMHFQGLKINQMYYATVVKEHALTMVMSYMDPSEPLTKALKSFKIK